MIEGTQVQETQCATLHLGWENQVVLEYIFAPCRAVHFDQYRTTVSVGLDTEPVALNE